MILKEKLEQIEKKRANSIHDMYIVAGQLQVSNISPIDSWTFFLWLQKQGIPSRYILKKSDDFHKEVEHHKDVISLDSFNKGYELLDLDIWERACAFVVEWDLGGTEVDYWLRDLPDCRYVFLQHGIIGTCTTNILKHPCHHVYNDVNVFSEREKNLIEGDTPFNKCFIGGLPRFEFLSKGKTKDSSEKVVFIMFTWRNVFSKNFEKIFTSEYWKGLTILFSRKEILAAKHNGVRFVVALHHSLLNNVKSQPQLENIELIEQGDIAKWINRADMLITDFSSVSFDFIYQNKPVIYWIPDRNDSLYEDGSLDRLKIDSALERRCLFFNQADTVDDVIKHLYLYIGNNFQLEEHKRKIIEPWFDYREGFSKRIYNRIEERLAAERFGYQSAQLLYEKKVQELSFQLVQHEDWLREMRATLGNRQKKIQKLRKTRKILIYLIAFLSIVIITMILCVKFL